MKHKRKINPTDKPKPKTPKSHFQPPPPPCLLAKRSDNFNILSNDPSLTGWGWVVLNKKGKILETGCIKTKGAGKKRKIRKGDENVQRVGEITGRLLQAIRQHDICYILTELPHGSQNSAGAMMIGVVIGALRMASDILDIGIEWYTEGDAKKCVFGTQSASKSDMIKAMSSAYGKDWKTGTKYKDEGIADALSIHYTAMKESSTLKLMKR